MTTHLIELADGGLLEYRGKIVRVGDTGLPQFIRYEHPGDDRTPGVEVGIEVVDGVPRCTFVGLKGQSDGPQVRTTDVKNIAGGLENLIQSSIAAAAFIRDDKDIAWYRTIGGTRGTRPGPLPDTRRRALPEIRRARKRSNRKVTDDLLQAVAEVYRNGGRTPTDAVRRTYGVSARTAARYVSLAREAGLLPETTQGKASK